LKVVEHQEAADRAVREATCCAFGETCGVCLYLATVNVDFYHDRRVFGLFDLTFVRSTCQRK